MQLIKPQDCHKNCHKVEGPSLIALACQSVIKNVTTEEQQFSCMSESVNSFVCHVL